MVDPPVLDTVDPSSREMVSMDSHTPDSPVAMDLEPATEVIHGPSLPPRFILVKHHKNAHKDSEIIPLENSCEFPSDSPVTSVSPSPNVRPWAPFTCLADCTFAYRCVSRRMPNNEIDSDLAEMRTDWAEGC